MKEINNFVSTEPEKKKNEESPKEYYAILNKDGEELAYGTLEEVAYFIGLRQNIEWLKGYTTRKVGKEDRMSSYSRAISGRRIVKYTDAYYTKSVVDRYERCKANKLLWANNTVNLVSDLFNLEISDDERDAINITLGVANRLVKSIQDQVDTILLDEI